MLSDSRTIVFLSVRDHLNSVGENDIACTKKKKKREKKEVRMKIKVINVEQTQWAC